MKRSSLGVCCLLMALLFAVSACFQFNDPDWYFWIPLYVTASLVNLLNWAKPDSRTTKTGGFAFCLGVFLFVKVSIEASVHEFWSLDMRERVVREKFGSGLVVVSMFLYLDSSSTSDHPTRLAKYGMPVLEPFLSFLHFVSQKSNLDIHCFFKEMGFEGFISSKWSGLVRHKRSKSFPGSRVPEEDKLDQSTEAAIQHKLLTDTTGHLNGCGNGTKRQSSRADIQNSLREEIMQLQKKLHEQVSVRWALETTLSYGASSCDITNETIIPKPAVELIKEIAVLELEVGHLEKYLLSLYRKAFDQRISSLSPSKKDEEFESPSATPCRRCLDFSRSDMTTVREKFAPEAETRIMTSSSEEANSPCEEKLVDSVVQHSHSSLSRRSALANRASLSAHSSGKYAQHPSSHAISLAEHLSTSSSGYIQQTPNKLSQDMVKCISDIYCRLAEPPAANHCLLSPTSSLSSTSAFSPKDQCDLWSPVSRNDSSFDNRTDSPFRAEGMNCFGGACSRTVEVLRLHKNGRKLSDTRYLLQNFRSLISQLKDIDPSKMTHEEKLAFWINVHNALVMHAFLAYGIPRNNMKRMFLLLKAAYNVGGEVVSADVIQNSILGCRMSCPGQWLRLLLASKTKLKASDERQAYATERPEPLLHYALSCGSHSDPAVRIYTPKAVFQELEAAKEDYIRASLGVGKDHKILLPKLVESYAKDSGLCPAGIMEMMQQFLPNSLSKSINEHDQLDKSRKNIEWVPHNFSFRYLMKDLGK
ncbi:hypothetical protein Salat_1400900 [Sesamum alatum]|uniref:DUF547 domain-containing protein n=1 Tax=Sesamum alatum TaxID=300844 RepID=A0AAE1Y9V6_9LAMI|nr:hypothetical protein Salat_1400900 [Sesamum alatum]